MTGGKPRNFDPNRLDYNDFASKLAGIKNAISTNEMMHEEIYSVPVEHVSKKKKKKKRRRPQHEYGEEQESPMQSGVRDYYDQNQQIARESAVIGGGAGGRSKSRGRGDDSSSRNSPFEKNRDAMTV